MAMSAPIVVTERDKDRLFQVVDLFDEIYRSAAAWHRTALLGAPGVQADTVASGGVNVNGLIPMVL